MSSAAAAVDPPHNTVDPASESEPELGEDEEYEEIEEEVEEEIEVEEEEEVEVEEEEEVEEVEEEEDEDGEEEVVEEEGAESDQGLADESNEEKSGKGIVEAKTEQAANGIAEGLKLPNEHDNIKQRMEEEEEEEEEEEVEEEMEEEEEVKEEEELEGEVKTENAEELTQLNEDHAKEGNIEEVEETTFAELAEGLSQCNENHIKGIRQVLEPARPEKLLGSDSATPQELVANPPLDATVIRDSDDNNRTDSPNDTNEGKKSIVDGNKTHIDDVNISLREDGVMPEKAFGCEINAAMLDVDPSSNGVIGVQYSKDMADQEAEQAVEDMEISPRSDAPRLRPRSLSPAADFNDKNKRPAIICDFFAKGWCIKGSSCRFLHVRDNAPTSSKEGSVDASKLKGILSGEGMKDTTEISAKNMPFRVEREATLRLKSGIEEVPLDKNLPLSDTSFKDKDIGREYLEHKPYLAKYSHSSSMLKDYSQNFGNSSFGRGLPSENYRNAGFPSYSSHLEGIRSNESQYLRDDHPLATLNSSVERVPLYPSASCWNPSPFGLQKPVEGVKEHSASGSVSLKHRSPPFSGSESTLISHPDLSAPTHYSSQFKPKPSFDNWEPSVPFQPSFLITRQMLSEASKYDPIRDSIEQTTIQDKPSQLPLSGQGASVSGTHVCDNADPVVTGRLVTEQSSNKHSVSSHSSHKDAAPRNLSEKETELMDTAGVHQDNIYYTALKGKKLLKSTDFGDTTEGDNDTVQKDGPKCKMELEVESAKRGNDVYGLVHQDARKQFQPVLVEFIKKLLNPTWKEGLLSRDAFKAIVKNTADAFLKTMQPQQFPDNSDSAKEYLSIAQPKLEKLVLGYVDKYGKS